MDLDMKLKFNFNKRNRYKNICSIEGCNNSACGKYCNKHYHQIKRYGNIKTRTRFDKNEIKWNLDMTSEIDKLKHFHVEDYSGTNFTNDLNDGEEFLYTTIGIKDDKEVTLLCKYVKNKHIEICPNCIFNNYLCYGLLCNIVVLKVVKDEEMRNNK